MPVIKSAKKKLRKDKKLTLANSKVEEKLKELVKNARKTPTVKSLSLAFSLTDKAVKKNIIHKNKAARLKSSLSKLMSGKTNTQSPKQEAKSKVKKSSKPVKKSK